MQSKSRLYLNNITVMCISCDGKRSKQTSLPSRVSFCYDLNPWLVLDSNFSSVYHPLDGDGCAVIISGLISAERFLMFISIFFFLQPIRFESAAA